MALLTFPTRKVNCSVCSVGTTLFIGGASIKEVVVRYAMHVCPCS